MMKEAMPEPGLFRYKFKGYYKAREFYVATYLPTSKLDLSNNSKTLFWKENVKCEANGTTTIEYLNTAATKGNCRINVEGVSNAGKLANEISVYNVSPGNN